MTTPITTSFGVTAEAKAAAAANKANGELDKEAFMNLLVAQLRNQDPSSPMDTSQMMAQTTQLSTMEKLTELADTQRESFALQMRMAAATLVGQQVTWTDDDGRRPHRERLERLLRGPRAHRQGRHLRRRPRRRLLRHALLRLHLCLTHPPKGTHHASFTLLRHQRSAQPPDHARRHRQQHRQRQHDRLQVVADAVPGHAVAGPAERGRRPAGHRWHQPGAGRPRRARRGHHHQLHAGCLADHRPQHRHDDPGRRLLHGPQGRRQLLHACRVVRLRRDRPDGAAGRGCARAGLGGRQRRRRHQRPAVRPAVPAGTLMAAVATSAATYEGNLDASAANGTVLHRTIDVFDALGNSRELSLDFTKTATGWSLDRRRRQTAPVDAGRHDVRRRRRAPWHPRRPTLTIGGVDRRPLGASPASPAWTPSRRHEPGRPVRRHAAVVRPRRRRHDHRCVQQRPQADHRPPRARLVHQPVGPGEGGRLAVPHVGQLRRARRSARPAPAAAARWPVARSRCRTSTCRASSPT